jgi:hypothetical protein
VASLVASITLTSCGERTSSKSLASRDRQTVPVSSSDQVDWPLVVATPMLIPSTSDMPTPTFEPIAGGTPETARLPTMPPPVPTATLAAPQYVGASVVPASGPFFYVNQSGTGTVNLPGGRTFPIVNGRTTLPNGTGMTLLPQHLYTFLDGRLQKSYPVSTGIGGTTPIRSGTLRLFDRGKKLRPVDPGWIVQGGVYVDDFWALFPDTDPDSQILIHTLPFHPYLNGKHDINSYYDAAKLGVEEASAGCIRMWPTMYGRSDDFGTFTEWAKTMQAEYDGSVPFTIGP